MTTDDVSLNKPGDLWAFKKPEGTLLIEIIDVEDLTISYETSWDPPSIAPPRRPGPVLCVEWNRWKRKGKKQT